MAHNIRGLLFDLDGVIIDSETEYSKIWRHINEVFPTGVPDLERVIKGCTLTSILTTYFPENQREEVKEMLYRLEGGMRYYYAPGGREILLRAREAGIPAALVTSSDDIKMSHLYEQIPELRGMFTAIVTAGDISRSKPDPEGYLLGASRLGLDASQCIVFEDSLQGLEAGRRAGAHLVAIASTLGRDRVADKAPIVVDDLSQINLNSLLNSL